jgi:hypothetical protein
MMLLQQNKKRREPGKKCHARTVMHSKLRTPISQKVFFSAKMDRTGTRLGSFAEELALYPPGL